MKWFKRDNAENSVDEAADSASSIDNETDDSQAESAEVSDSSDAKSAVPDVDQVEAPAGRMRGRLFSRMRGNKGGLGAALASLFAGKPDAAVWEMLEESLLMADVGVETTTDLVKTLQRRLGSSSTADDARQVVREELIAVLNDGQSAAGDNTSTRERTLGLLPPGATAAPQVVMVVGVNGTGKTTTTGKLARMLVGQGYSVVLAAADTFRAAAAEQLQTWGQRVGVPVIRKEAGADPASVAFDAYDHAVKAKADVLLVDTAGRLHTKQGLMDELGKVARVLGRHGDIAHTVLVLDATTGRNGLTQAKVFSDVVPVTSIALTKLDGTAKGGIVISVQRELGIPVSLVGLGEGADDLAFFDPVAFVDALVE